MPLLSSCGRPAARSLQLFVPPFTVDLQTQFEFQIGMEVPFGEKGWKDTMND